MNCRFFFFVCILLVSAIGVFAIEGSDTETAAIFSLTPTIQRLLVDTCTDPETGTKFLFTVNGRYCRNYGDLGNFFDFVIDVQRATKTRAGSAARTTNSCASAPLYQTVCNACENRNNQPPLSGSGWCCSNKLISNPPTCPTNVCETNQYACDLSAVVCQKKADGADCATGKKCVGGQCITACTNQCTAGAKQCSGAGYQACSDTNGDGCTEWGTVTSCGTGKTCSNGQCVTACTNQCTAGAKQCSGTGYQTCADTNGDGCTEWGTVTTCPSGQTCANGQCGCAAPTALCGTSCVNTQIDNRNCGACGTICATGTTCQIGVCKSLCVDNDKDGYGVGDLTPCTQKVADCNDNNNIINPGAAETQTQSVVVNGVWVSACADNIDNDCDGSIDYDGGTFYPGKKGDSGCIFSIISLAFPPAVEGTTIDFTCTSTVTNVRSIVAKVENTACPFGRWDGTKAVFQCNVGSYSPTGKKVSCSIDTSISPIPPSEVTSAILVQASDCSRYTNAQCITDPRCTWCSECSGSKYSGGPNRCVAKTSGCVYGCAIGRCNAACDRTDRSWVKAVSCDDVCQSGYMLQLRKATINNDCDYNSCTIIQPQCPPGTTQQCPRTQCGPHQIGCQTPCNEAGMPTDGTDATCGACSPACACEPGYFDMDRYAANGCEYQCTPSNNGVEKCDNVDNNCNGQKDEGLPSCGCSGGIPTQETCNNRDDDCNGRVDEGLTGCACAQGPPAAEVCNGNDDNCNGQVDDGVGLCGAGSQCIRGSCSCTQTYSRSCAELDQKIKNRLERQGKWDNAKQSKKVVEHQGKYYACENKVDNACCTAYENGLPIGAGKVCVYNGKCYAPGMTIPLGDGATLQCS